MREYQEVGLKKEAREFLKANVKMVPCTVCPKCGEVINKKQDFTILEEVDLFYGDGPTLLEYHLKDGSTVQEFIQAEPWSSGPMAFFVLKDKESRKIFFKWTEDEMDEYL